MKLEELFESYLGGEMSGSDKAIFEKLLDENPEYQSQLNTFRQQKHQFGTDAFSSESTSKSNPVKNWSISIAIALVIVLVGYFLFSMLGMSPGEKLYTKYYQTPPFRITESALSTDEASLKTEAFQAYDAKEFEKAAASFEKISTQGDSDYLLLYHGICQLELGRPEKAIPLLNRVRSGSEAAPKEVAAWFAAMGYFKLNMLDKGKESLQVTASNPNTYQAQAKTILESLK